MKGSRACGGSAGGVGTGGGTVAGDEAVAWETSKSSTPICVTLVERPLKAEAEVPSEQSNLETEVHGAAGVS